MKVTITDDEGTVLTILQINGPMTAGRLEADITSDLEYAYGYDYCQKCNAYFKDEKCSCSG